VAGVIFGVEIFRSSLKSKRICFGFCAVEPGNWASSAVQKIKKAAREKGIVFIFSVWVSGRFVEPRNIMKPIVETTRKEAAERFLFAFDQIESTPVPKLSPGVQRV
jgi:hypothetical protein